MKIAIFFFILYAFLCPRRFSGVIFLFPPKAYLTNQQDNEYYIKDNNKWDAKKLQKIY